MVIRVVKIFFVQFSVYFFHLFLISSASVRSLPSVLYWAHLYMKCSLGISNFLEEISSLSHVLFSSISLHWSLRKAFLSLAILWNSAFNAYIFPFLLCVLLVFFTQLFVRQSGKSKIRILQICVVSGEGHLRDSQLVPSYSTLRWWKRLRSIVRCIL